MISVAPAMAVYDSGVLGSSPEKTLLVAMAPVRAQNTWFLTFNRKVVFRMVWKLKMKI